MRKIRIELEFLGITYFSLLYHLGVYVGTVVLVSSSHSSSQSIQCDNYAATASRQVPQYTVYRKIYLSSYQVKVTMNDTDPISHASQGFSFRTPK